MMNLKRRNGSAGEQTTEKVQYRLIGKGEVLTLGRQSCVHFLYMKSPIFLFSFFFCFNHVLTKFLYPNYFNTTTIKPYPTKWLRLHWSNYATMFYHKPYVTIRM